MSLPLVPLRTLDNDRDIESLYKYLHDFLTAFPNASGEAIDPTVGQGGAGALDISDVVVASYVSGVTNSTDNVQYGFVDVTFTLPLRAVKAVIQYRAAGTLIFKTVYGPTSPYRILNLMPGSAYEFQIAGQSANDKVGPYTAITVVTVPVNTSLLSTLMFSGVKKTQDQIISVLSDISEMNFNVLKDHYYHIKFGIVGRPSDGLEASVTFSMTSPAAYIAAMKKV